MSASPATAEMELAHLFALKEADRVMGPCAARAYRAAVREQVQTLRASVGDDGLADVAGRLILDGGRWSEGRHRDIERALRQLAGRDLPAPINPTISLPGSAP